MDGDWNVKVWLAHVACYGALMLGAVYHQYWVFLPAIIGIAVTGGMLR